VTTRRRILLLLHDRPGSTVRELAQELSLTMAGVRRHLDQLTADGLVEQRDASATAGARRGRPPAGWRLSPSGEELFPRRYDGFALELLEDLADTLGPEAVEGVLACRAEKLADGYRAELDGAEGLDERVRRIAWLRDDAGYQAECLPAVYGEVVLVQHNCALHRVAEQHPALCEMEHVVFRRALGPGVEVTRISHALNGDATCSYRVRPRPPGDGRRR
jgi:predicted ArsR family transcriptional regulator